MQNFHGTALKLTFNHGEFGVLITGTSGSGKSLLALRILREQTMDWQKAELISDDQVLLKEQNGAIIASPPKTIAGKIELRGFGIIEDVAYVSNTPINLLAKISDKDMIERMPEDEYEIIMGLKIKRILLPKDNFSHALFILNYVLNDMI